MHRLSSPIRPEKGRKLSLLRPIDEQIWNFSILGSNNSYRLWASSHNQRKSGPNLESCWMNQWQRSSEQRLKIADRLFFRSATWFRSSEPGISRPTVPYNAFEKIALRSGVPGIVKSKVGRRVRWIFTNNGWDIAARRVERRQTGDRRSGYFPIIKMRKSDGRWRGPHQKRRERREGIYSKMMILI